MASLSKRATVYFDPAIHRALKIKAAETTRSISDIVDDALRRELAEDEEDLRAFEERAEETAAHKEGAVGKYHYYPLAKGKTDRHMEPLYIVVQPCDDSCTSSHEGEEFVIVVKGEVELVYGKQSYHLREGDSMHYNSVVPHHLGAANGEAAEIFAVIYTPI